MATPRFITEYWRILTGQDIATDPEDTQSNHGTATNPNDILTQVNADEARHRRLLASFRLSPKAKTDASLLAKTSASIRKHDKDLAEPFSFTAQLGLR